jgi:hypothetical protein
MLTKTFLAPTVAEERHRSAGQMSLALQTWLTQEGKTSLDTAEKIGRKFHHISASTYQKIWHRRCDEMKTRKLLFNDRMRLFPRQKPVQGLTKDDYVFFAEAWANLQKQRGNPSNNSNAHCPHTRPTKKARCERTAELDGQHPTPMLSQREDSSGLTKALGRPLP